MNGKQAKKLRRAFRWMKAGTKTVANVYRRMKRIYSTLAPDERKRFMAGLK